MFITALLCAKPKSKFVLVACRSQVSGHTINLIRERLGDKFEFMQFDPFVQTTAYYKEHKKVRSLKNWKGQNTYTNGYNSRMVGEEFQRMQ
ncbi:39S ribosomal protein L33, mitochondrial isoform X2 [Fopius arisanus]|uniref:39S ribosomal protein L33, mitochondrial isoform X2 n=1 Tax=Fopius arisanus TaxID=64838 RepID=A0A9R1TRZ7_9HYME|nr:PREDICTED: 39S ribosomal protein L33, mitochondrial isoform X2 [Fopius arisanus]